MSLVLGRWPVALPLSDTAEGIGAGAAVSDPAPPPAADTGSLADHEAAFSPDASRVPASPDPDDDDPPESDRRADGTFKPRHRAASQRADADDVPLISEHTRRIKEAEAKLGADIARKPGESDRVYNLRRRAELLERFASGSEKPAAVSAVVPSQPAAPQPTAPPVLARRPDPVPQTFPSYEQFIAFEGNSEKTYEEYVDARADWRYAVRREQERAEEAAESALTTRTREIARYNAGVTAAKAKYANWDQVVTADAHVTPTLTAAILASEHGAEIAYYLGTHPDERVALNADTPDPAPTPSAVAALRRYLDSLVAGQRTPAPSSRTAAAPTGSAPAPVAPVAPRPPNPVRTGSIAAPETPPGDDSMSISEHEKHYGARRR